MNDFLAQAWPFAAAVLVILGIVALVFLIIIRIVDGRRKTEGSVEEYILDVFKQKLEVRIGRSVSS